MDFFHSITVTINQLSLIDGIAKISMWISWLGIGYLYYLIAAILILKGKDLGVKLWYFWTITAMSNALLKYTFTLPRPYWIDLNINVLEKSTSFGMPSGHAQSAVGILLLLWGVKKWRFMGWVWLVVVMLARMIVGVHSLDQVLVGASLGLILLWYFVGDHRKIDISIKSQWGILVVLFLYGVYRIKFGVTDIQHLGEVWVRAPQDLQTSFKVSSLFVPFGFLSGFLVGKQFCIERLRDVRLNWLIELVLLLALGVLLKSLLNHLINGVGDLIFALSIGYYLGLKTK
jgi:membrane-associated phospholipid phosphatase